MAALQLCLLCCFSVARLTWAQSCNLDKLETNTTVADYKSVKEKQMYADGEKSPYKCRPGFQQTSPPPSYRNATCIAGTWQYPADTLICEVKCEWLKDPAHGIVVYFNNDTSVGSTILFRCNYGPTALSARCQAGGVWEHKPPSCPAPPNVTNQTTAAPSNRREKECPPLREPDYGRLLRNHTTNSSAVFACNEGYVMQGTSRMVCQMGGTWDPPQAPTCEAPFPWVIVGSAVAAALVVGTVGVVCLWLRRRPRGYRRQIRKPSASDSHTQNEVAHLHKPYPVTSL